ncbi:MAG: UbiD family decarboxylase [Phycisphaerales bacterium]|nr:UbiD family decarboxylase [Phycisphaerales bacterium]
MYRSLGEFIDALDRAGELVRIKAPVSPLLEISEIADRVSKATAPTRGLTGQIVDPDHASLGGPALLFENIQGAESDIPVAINLFGSYHRMEMALGCHDQGHTPGGFEAIADRIASLTRPEPPAGLGALLRKALEFAPLLRTPPRLVRAGACQQVVKTGSSVNLLELPINKCWPLDGDLAAVGYPTPAGQPDMSVGQGRFITFAGMYTIHADDAGKARPPSRNIGMYRAQLIDRTRLIMHWHMHHDGARHWRSWKRLGQPMPIAIAFGGESVLPYAATCPLPPGVSELLMAGFLNRRGIPLVKCRTIPLHVPANAEIIIEGWVSTQAGGIGFDPRATDEPLGPGAAFEGPFGDHTGYYSLPDRYPIVEVSAITHRRNPVYPSTIVGLPPQEDYYLGKATERLMLPLLRTLIPDIIDYDLPMFGAFHNCAFIQIRKEYPLQARRVMHAVWGAGQMAWTKFIIVVDDDVNVHKRDEVLAAIFRNCDFERDLELVNGPLDILDHAAPRLGAGHKLGIDATRKIAGEEVNGIPISRPRQRETLASSLEISGGGVAGCLPEFGLGRCLLARLEEPGATDHRTELEAGLQDPSPGAPDWIILVDDIDPRDIDGVLFRWCANCDPGRDMIRRGPRIAFDATAKKAGTIINGHRVRDYPPILEMSEEIRQRVTHRWSEYGLDRY